MKLGYARVSTEDQHLDVGAHIVRPYLRQRETALRTTQANSRTHAHRSDPCCGC